MRDPKTPRRPRGRRLASVILIVLIAVGLLLAALYLNRRAAARVALVGWLERQGIEAEVEVDRIELDGFVGRIRIGDPRNPDFVVERAEVDYAVALPWAPGGLGLAPSRIRLIRPVLKATWTQGRLSLGSLDPLIEDFTRRPVGPDRGAPIVIVETGRVRLTTEYGPVQILADARTEDGRLMRLSARMPAASLKSGEVEARSLEGRLDVITTGDRVGVRMDVAAERFAAGGSGGTDARILLNGDLPYPDLKAQRADGTARLSVVLTGSELTAGGTSATQTRLGTTFDGRVSGWIETFGLEGRVDATLSARRLTGPELDVTGIDATVSGADLTVTGNSEGVTWRGQGGVRGDATSGRIGGLQGRGLTVSSTDLTLGGRGSAFEVGGPVRALADRMAMDDLALRGVSADLLLDGVQDGALNISVSGSARAQGGSWPLFGPVAGDDIPELAAMKTALGDFAVNLPAFRLTTGGQGTRLTLQAPARITPRNGGALTLTAAAAPLFEAEPGQAGGGAVNVTATRGAGLPEATFAIPAWRLTPGGFSATLDGRAALDFGLGRGIVLSTRGELASDRGRLTYVARECIPLTVERLELDENDITEVAGSFCPPLGPMVTVADGRWQARGTLKDISAEAPFLALRFSEAQGTLVVDGGPAGLTLDARIATAQVEDATQPRRFNTATASGGARLDGERWSGAFDLAIGPHALGTLTLAHDGATGVGGIVIASRDLTFVEGGLQPETLTPLVADFVQSPVTGTARFDGRIDWAGTEGTSSGVLTVPDLNFTSPAGGVTGLSGRIVFDSLTPLVTAADQSVRIARLEAIAPLTDLDLTFSLDKAAINVAGGELNVGGGTLRVEPFAVPLDPSQSWSGVVTLDRVQLGELIAGSGFGDKVTLDAVVSGRVPFSVDPAAGPRVSGGRLYAVQPGRLEIKREVLSGLEAGGGGEAVPPGVVEDLAYQAMENLSFDTLTADVDSQDGGRLGVRFHILGRHDPPQNQELRLTWLELIRRDFLNRNLPLPSGTGIDLTLDTTLNLDQLISDMIALNRARNGDATTVSPD
jgi:hypothetical protein